MVTREGALANQPEYVLRFAPPLTISNLLPYSITVIVSDAPSVSAAEDPTVFHIPVGGRAEVYEFDLLRKLRCVVQMGVHTFPIHPFSLWDVRCPAERCPAELCCFLAMVAQATLPHYHVQLPPRIIMLTQTMR